MSLDLVPVDREPAAGAVLLTGIPGSGKSTVAAALAGFVPVLDDVVVRRSHLDFYRTTLTAVVAAG